MITVELTKPSKSTGGLTGVLTKLLPKWPRVTHVAGGVNPCNKVEFIKESELGKNKFPVGSYVTYASTIVQDKIPITLMIVVDHEEVYSQARFSGANGMPRTVGGRFINQTSMVPYTAADNPVYHWAGDLRLLSKEEKEHVDARVREISQQKNHTAQ